jgi:hypothetical protein
MFAQPPQTAKLKSILKQELGPLFAQQKSQLSAPLASQAIDPSEIRTSGVAHDQHSRPWALNESFLVEIVDTAEALIGGDPRSSSDFAQSTTEGTDHKGFVDRRHDARFFLLLRG